MLISDSHELIRWYKDNVRPFLVSNLDEDKVGTFDKDRDRLQRAVDLLETELAVCFLGNSGVGKSTLINAVIGGDRAVVPSGGVGPLTAQALVVRHSDQARFEVEYHSAGQLLRTVFGLEQMYRAELGGPTSAQDDLEISDELEEPDLVQFEPAPDSDDGGDGASHQARQEKREGLRRRAQLLVTGVSRRGEGSQVPARLDERGGGGQAAVGNDSRRARCRTNSCHPICFSSGEEETTPYRHS